ncbi:hypothetical protein [Burkholderia stagnalis]|uniref:hypothetical protein n=1 Tax=Burkholderia stagnalis TaxID=1503054 RepID=UPI0012DAF57B|nr:hypothetical protein [Burkholderia stagnalis]
MVKTPLDRFVPVWDDVLPGGAHKKEARRVTRHGQDTAIAGSRAARISNGNSRLFYGVRPIDRIIEKMIVNVRFVKSIRIYKF